jgi:6-phosphogluconolactonase (cycloisomerase 2 family)
MRMKFNKTSQLLLVSAASLLAASLVTACETLTVDFVFVTSSKAAGSNNYGEVDVFEINSESGFMRQIPSSPFPSAGRNPVAEALSSDNQNLYVINRDDSSIVQFAIGNDGKLYPQATTDTTGNQIQGPNNTILNTGAVGIFPLGATVAGSNLFVANTYQPLPACSPAFPCSGSVGVYPLSKSGALGVAATNGSISYWPLNLSGTNSADIILPTGLASLASGAELYVSAYDTTANTGYVFGFNIGSSGTLSPITGSPWTVGTHPSALIGDPTSKYLYVTDFASGNVLGYNLTSSGVLSTPLAGSPYATGSQPSAITTDPASGWVYVANSQDSTVTAFSITGGPLARIGTYPTGLQPVAIGVDPSHHHFLFTVNYLGNTVAGSVSGFELGSDGSLIPSQDSPYTSNAQPTAAVAIPHNGSN